MSFFTRAKIHAFLSHLAASATVVGAVFALIWFYWYPAPLFELTGAWSVVKVLIMVDLVLGPLLTLVLYKPGKRLLWLDMSIILIIQVWALVYGVNIIHSERPCYMVYNVDRFTVVPCAEIPPDAVADRGDIGPKKTHQPLYVIANLPTDRAEFQKLQEEVIFRGAPDIDFRPYLWSAYAEPGLSQVRKASSKYADTPLPPEMQQRLEATQQRFGLKQPPMMIPVKANKHYYTLLLHPDTGKQISYLPVNLWELRQ